MAITMFKVTPITASTLAVAKKALGIIRQSDLGSDAKEVFAQKAALPLFWHFSEILWRFLAVVAVAFLPILISDAVELASADTVKVFPLRRDIIVILSTVLIAGWCQKGRVWYSK
ncbi:MULTISPECIES: hypothetical protein [unclassified Ruegeria]|uniref:hypothetical protein n=1 Tax=unclassified Ruegeria TaxID=2625375 RepID=UPI001AE65EE7|nr:MULTISPECIES: hypothetical protein [unclassified Ruegeria]